MFPIFLDVRCDMLKHSVNMSRSVWVLVISGQLIRISEGCLLCSEIHDSCKMGLLTLRLLIRKQDFNGMPQVIRENGGTNTLGMGAPLTINPIYTLCEGFCFGLLRWIMLFLMTSTPWTTRQLHREKIVSDGVHGVFSAFSLRCFFWFVGNWGDRWSSNFLTKPNRNELN